MRFSIKSCKQAGSTRDRVEQNSGGLGYQTLLGAARDRWGTLRSTGEGGGPQRAWLVVIVWKRTDSLNVS